MDSTSDEVDFELSGADRSSYYSDGSSSLIASIDFLGALQSKVVMYFLSTVDADLYLENVSCSLLFPEPKPDDFPDK